MAKLLYTSCVSAKGAYIAASLDSTIQEMVEKVHHQYSPSLKLVSPHAECTLLHHHKRNPAIIPFTYVGVSKLACYACALYIEAHNNSTPLVPFSIQGTRGHVYPWQALGGEAEKDLYAYMLENIHKVLGKTVYDTDLSKRKPPESTAASCGSDRDQDSGGEAFDGTLIFYDLEIVLLNINLVEWHAAIQSAFKDSDEESN